jgi:midasin
VAVELLQPQDLVSIATALHPELPGNLILRMVQLLTAMQAAAGSSSSSGSSSSGRAVPFAVAGGPWEFNLRDLLRWCELVTLFAQQQQQQQRGSADAMEVDAPQQQLQSVCPDALLDAAAEHYLGVLFTQRLRTAADRQRLQELFAAVWGRPLRAASSTNVLPDLQQSLAVSAAAAGSSDAAAAEADSAAAVLCSSRPSVIITPGELCVGMARIPRAMGAAAAAAAVGVPPSVAPSDSAD